MKENEELWTQLWVPLLKFPPLCSNSKLESHKCVACQPLETRRVLSCLLQPIENTEAILSEFYQPVRILSLALTYVLVTLLLAVTKYMAKAT